MNHGGPAVAIVGATASGKSALAHAVALSGRDVSIFCVDAMTVYRGMDIGTAKPTIAQRREVDYHLLDLVDASEEYTVAQFQAASREAASEVWSLGGAVIYAGGTGLYGRAVIDNLAIPGQYPDVRRELASRVDDDLAGLYAELVALDPIAASRMEPTNARRIVRALEVCVGAQRPFSSYGDGLLSYGPARVVQVGLRSDFALLDQKIEERFRGWMEEGLLAEVERLASAPAPMSRTARQAVGYRELLHHIELGTALEECVSDAIAKSRRLARRQRSWFERDPRIEWYDDHDEAARRLAAILSSPDGFVRD